MAGRGIAVAISLCVSLLSNRVFPEGGCTAVPGSPHSVDSLSALSI